MVNTLRGTLKPFPHGSGQNVTVQPISLENGLAHMASLPSVRAKVLGSSTGKTCRWVKSISLLKGIKNTVEPRTCDVVSSPDLLWCGGTTA